MHRTLFLIISFIFFVTLSKPGFSQGTETGPLVIAGGAIGTNSRVIFEEFVKLSGGADAKIAVVPAATKTIDKQYRLLINEFGRLGVPEGNITLLPLAINDDKSTKKVNEARWKTNGNNPSVVEQIQNSNAVWFIGGDQTRITAVLLNQDGSDSEALSAIRKLNNKGGVIGGTSAGAAIMSEIMIAGGNSQGAILEGRKESFASMDEQEYGPLVTKAGLNFFENGIIDQHFDRKARLGRLVALLLQDKQHLGFGVDEGTAMIVKQGVVSVVGEGGVTIVNTAHSEGFKSGKLPITVNNVRLSFLQPGDEYGLAKASFEFHESSNNTVTKEYFNVPKTSVTGLMSSNRNLDEFIGYNLIDNKATTQTKSWLLDGEQGVELIFSQDKHTEGHWRTDLTKDVYSFKDVRLDIRQVRAQLSY